MLRKLVKQGDNALTITLPAQWTKKFKFKAGDSLSVAEQGADIIISSLKDTESDKITLDVSGGDPMIRRMLSSAYKAGFDKLEVIYEKPEELKTIQFAIDQEFIGFEIVEQGKNRIMATKISNIEHSEFDVMLRRTFLFLLQMAEDTAEAVKKQDFEEMKNIALRDHSINKFTDFCRRALNKKADVKYKRIPPLYFIVEEIEKVGDCYRDICRDLSSDKLKLKKETIILLENVNKFMRLFYDAFYSFDLKKISLMGAERQKLKEKFEKVFSSLDKKEAKAVFHMFNLFNLVFDMNGPLMAVNY